MPYGKFLSDLGSEPQRWNCVPIRLRSLRTELSHPHTGDLQGRAGLPFLTKKDVLMDEVVSCLQIGLPKGEAAPPPSAWAC